MITTYRPLTDHERKGLENSIQSLQKRLSPPRPLQDMWHHFVIGCILGFFAGILPALFLLLFAPGRPYILPVWGAILVGCAVYLSLKNGLTAKPRMQTREKSRADDLARDIRRRERGEKEIVHYVVYGAVRVSSPQFTALQRTMYSHGYFFDEDVLCDLGNNEAILLPMDSLDLIEAEMEYEDMAPGDIPTQWELEWVRWPNESGGKLQDDRRLPLISRTVCWRSKEAIRQLKHGEIVSGVSFATLEQDFPHLFGPT